MSELPEINHNLERFVARRMLDLDLATWNELTVEKRRECIRAARRALKAERLYFDRAAAKEAEAA